MSLGRMGGGEHVMPSQLPGHTKVATSVPECDPMRHLPGGALDSTGGGCPAQLVGSVGRVGWLGRCGPAGAEGGGEGDFGCVLDAAVAENSYCQQQDQAFKDDEFGDDDAGLPPGQGTEAVAEHGGEGAV